MSDLPILDSLGETIVVAAQEVDEELRLVGGAGLALLLHHRRSDDVDLFAPGGAPLQPIVDAVRAAAHNAAATVASVRTTPSFVRLEVVKGADVLRVDIANDASARLADAELVGRIRVESLRDQRANKLVTVLGRSELRDLVDLFFIDKAGLPALDGLADALLKDGGVDFAWLAWAIDQVQMGEPPGMTTTLDMTELERFRDGLREALLDRAGAAG